MSALKFFEQRSKPFWVITGIALVVLIGLLDFLTGHESSFSLFYLFPIFLIVWYTNWQLGLLFALAATITGFAADYSAGLTYSSATIFIWNILIRLGVFSAVSVLSFALKKSYRANQALARIDYMTGATSVRYFYDLAQIEMARSLRYKRPFTLAYLDLDDFKAVNNRLGHSAGDRLLRSLTEGIQKQIRPGDILARLGGDEFAMLLPETNGDAAKAVIARIHASLVDEMLRNGRVVTFSVGVVTFYQVPKSVDEMVKQADAAMYSIKSKTKNGVAYKVYPD